MYPADYGPAGRNAPSWRELAEMRCRAHPAMLDGLRRLREYQDEIEQYWLPEDYDDYEEDDSRWDPYV